MELKEENHQKDVFGSCCCGKGAPFHKDCMRSIQNISRAVLLKDKGAALIHQFLPPLLRSGHRKAMGQRDSGKPGLWRAAPMCS